MNEKTPQEPVSNVVWVYRGHVRANDYNPNRVNPRELALLKLSIMSDGWTQPIVTIREGKWYTIVDGFHRYFVSGDEEVHAKTNGFVPVVVLKKPLGDRMAATVRHNRARGRHLIEGMSGIVYGMLKEGKTDTEVCEELGMAPEELFRLKHVTGYAKLFEGCDYSEEFRAGHNLKDE